ncbi:MAG: hypothetical protein R2711_14105 [Acidimicrobiales bacterium]
MANPSGRDALADALRYQEPERFAEVPPVELTVRAGGEAVVDLAEIADRRRRQRVGRRSLARRGPHRRRAHHRLRRSLPGARRGDGLSLAGGSHAGW